jgi:predicted ATPase/DNA-binding XRE family transcriptional regulator/Tfp pilus assembly protein PilF
VTETGCLPFDPSAAPDSPGGQQSLRYWTKEILRMGASWLVLSSAAVRQFEEPERSAFSGSGSYRRLPAVAIRNLATFSDLLRHHRLGSGWTQEELAARAGLSERSIRALEGATRIRPHRYTVAALADAFQLSPQERRAFEAAARGPSVSMLHLVPEPTGPPPHNIPWQSTSFVGRERETATLLQMIGREDVRLVTLTGPGGMGKTRLALHVARELLPEYEDGVFFISLAGIMDPALVVPTIASTLDVDAVHQHALQNELIAYLRDRQMLLIIDNFEHVLSAAPVLTSLLETTLATKFLVTSRAALRLSAEYCLAIPPLSVPEGDDCEDPNRLSRNPAVTLFLDRAQAVRPDFCLTADNVRSIAQLCIRLDGWPLPIELAAARIAVLPPSTLVDRLVRRFALLDRGPRNAHARHQTLRATLDWSYELLSAAEQTLFARLSVFAGGCSLEAAEAICDREGDLDILAGLTELVEQSLLRQVRGDEPRFSMLETIREYAAEKLNVRDDASGLHDRHARYYLERTEKIEPELRGPQQGRWLDRLETDHDNLRTALSRLLERGQVEEQLRLATALYRFWIKRGHWNEGIQWLAAGLAKSDAIAGLVRAGAMCRIGWLLGARGELESAASVLEEALGLCQTLDDRGWQARVLFTLGSVVYARGDVARAKRYCEESLALSRELRDSLGTAVALYWLGVIVGEQGDFALAESYFRQQLALAREMGDTGGVAESMCCLGRMLTGQGRYDEAEAVLEESLTLMREIRLTYALANALDGLACVATEQGDAERAMALFSEAIAVCQDLNDERSLVDIVGHMAELAMTQGNAERGTRLAGAAAAGRQTIQAAIPRVGREHRERALARACQDLGEDAFRLAWEAGRDMSLEEALAYALRV